MGKISKEEMPAILPVMRTRITLLRSELQQLQVGEGYFLPKEEWKTKSTPSHIIGYLKRTRGMVFEYGFKTDGTGWLFKRIN
jgi:hypothetical protein